MPALRACYCPASNMLLPERALSRVLWGILAAGALAWLLGEQGARLGRWAWPAWEWTHLVTAGLVAFLLAPSRSQALSRRRAVLAAASLALLAGPIDAWRRDARRSDYPVAGRVYALGSRMPEATVGLQTLRLPRRGVVRRLLGRGENLVLQVRGVLYVPTAGRHRFEVKADDGCMLYIDGRLVLPETGEGEVDLDLARGPHVFGLSFRQEREAASLRVQWDRPDVFELLSLEHHLADDPGQVTPRRLLRKRMEALGALAVSFAWFGAAAGLVVLAGESKRVWLGPWIARARRLVRADPHLRPAAAVFITSVLFLGLVEAIARPHSPDGFYLQRYSSEYLMQTVSAADLRDEPLRSLWYLHIQPPLLDTLRATLARVYRSSEGDALVRKVDAGLYAAWGFVSSALAGLMCLWLCRLAGPRFAVPAALVFVLHPASVFYATLLDGTLVSAFGVTWCLYELWRLRGEGGSPWRLGAAILLLFFTRSVFQWPFLLVAGASLALLGVPWKRLAAIVGLVGLVMGAYVAKQYLLFGITFTSSFAADNFCKGLHEYCPGVTGVARPPLPEPTRARVLSRTAKLNGEYNYNQVAFLRRSFAQMEEYRQLLRTRSASQNLDAVRRNVAFWLRPSSRYTDHVLVDRLPWRAAFDRLFSGAPLLVLLALAGAGWLLRPDREDLRTGLALALPVGYVFVVSVLFEGGENMRFKFFLEPALFVFLAAQLRAGAAAAQRARRAALRRD
jgi:hypothetical protein